MRSWAVGRLLPVIMPGARPGCHMHFNMEWIRAPGCKEVITLTNTAHPVSSSLALARSTQSTYTDYGM